MTTKHARLDPVSPLHATKPGADPADGGPASVAESAEALVQQLDIHRLELGAQNEALLEIQQALQESRDRYASLFDNAPVPYLMLDEAGMISEINLPGAALLGEHRSKLLKRRFTDFLLPEAVSRWRRYVDHEIDQEGQRYCDLQLRRGGNAFWARLAGCRFAEPGGLAVVRLGLEDISERKQLEQALRDTTADLQRAQAVAQVGSWRFAVGSGNLTWSTESYLIFGIAPGTKLSYERFLDTVHPQDRVFVDNSWRAALRGEPYDIEHRIIVGDDVRWVRERGELEFSAEGRLVSGFGTVQDITERKVAREALVQKERYQRALLDNFPFLVWLKDTESHFLAVNDHFARMFGADSADSLVGKTDFDVVPAQVAKGYQATDQQVLASRQQVTLEEKIPGENPSSAKWFETYKAPVFDDRGGLLGTVGFAREITARKRTEESLLRVNDILEEQVAERTAEAEERAQALFESERFFRATIDALPSILCVLDERGRIVAVNKAWRQFAAANGGNPDQVSEGADYLAVCDVAVSQSEETAREVANAIRKILAGRRRELVLEYECSSQSRQRWFEMTISRFAGEGPVRLVVVHDDITESKLLAAEQRETAARLKRLAAHLESVREEQCATIAREIHDELGGTLTMLKLSLATAKDDLSESAPMIARVQGMLEQVDSALQTVKRISSNLRPAMLDALGLIPTIKWHAEQFSRLTGIAVDLHMPDYVRLSASGNMGVYRIVQEGLTNVAKHSGATKVKITLLKHKGHLIVRIADNGIGLPDDSTRRYDSFGVIGMRERAQNLGGQLSLTGTRLIGTQLTLRIPLNAGTTSNPQRDSQA